VKRVLVCDLGSTNFRAALVDDSGKTAARHTVSMTGKVETSGRSGIDPDLWWQAFTGSVEALARTCPAEFPAIDAIAISGLTRSQVLIDANGKPIAPALLWNDIRAGETLEALIARCPADHPEMAGLNAFHPVARLFWLKTCDPARFAKARQVFDPKDYLNFRLTGVAASDPVSLARLAAAAQPGPSGATLLEAAGLLSSLIPTLNPPVSIMGRVQHKLVGALSRLAGIPVITMANDTWAGVVGLGAMRPGFGYNLTGTTEVLGLVSSGQAEAQGLLSVDWSGGLSQLGGPSQCGGDTLAWLLELLGGTEGASDTLDRILTGPRDADPVLFLPYLQGERVPYWDPSLRGAIVGLNRRHRPVDLAYGVMEGVGFLNRIVLERAEAATGGRVGEIRFGGGGAANPLWCQIKADILGRPIGVVESDEVGLLGAAITALTAIGHFPDLSAAQDRLEKNLPPRNEKTGGL
jgi:xylulokinase